MKREEYYRLCRSDLTVWAREVLKPFNQAPDPAHIKIMLEKLSAVARGEIDRLMIFMPPRHAKSTISSIIFPPWFLAQNPRESIIAASHTDALAKRFGRAVRNLVTQYSDLLGYSLSQDSKAADTWMTSMGGEYKAAGVNQGISGRPASLFLVDDPVKNREEAESESVKERTWEWYRGDVYPRLEPGGRIILIQTRWSEDDLGGRLLNEMALGKDQWTVINFPALANSADDPLGRQVNEALWPERYSREHLERIRANISPGDWWSEYMQEPRPPGGAFYILANCLVGGKDDDPGQPVPMPSRPDSIFAVMDTAVKDGSKNDGTAIMFCARTKGRNIPLVVLDWNIVQIEGAFLVDWLPSMMDRGEELARLTQARMGFTGVWCEDKGSGTILIQQAHRRNQLVREGRLHGENPWRVFPIADDKERKMMLVSAGKDGRALNASGYISRGDVKISDHAYNKTMVYKGQMANHFLRQVFGFRLGVDHGSDDLADCWSYSVALSLGNAKGF